MDTQLVLDAVYLSLFAGSAIFLGALIAGREHIQPHWLEEELHHTVIATGGGVLLAAVALVLVPEGIARQPLASTVVSFLAGGMLFMWLDGYLARHKTTASQLVAMMLDFIPEAIIIGAIITKDYPQALLLAFLIFVQNLPESFNAYREIRSSTQKPAKQLLFWFFLIGITGPVYILLGTAVLKEHDLWLSRLMTFCAGGILYIVFNDIAPQAKLERHHLPALGTLMGFLIGIAGKVLID